MDDNEYNLDLPEHLRHLVAKDAPVRVQAALVEFEGGGEIIPLLAGAWRLSAKPKWQQYRVQIFLANLEATSFLRLDNHFNRLVSKEDYEIYPPFKIKWMTSGTPNDKIERHLFIEGIEERVKLLAARQELLHGCWLTNEGRWHPDSLFSHQIFASYREFFELSDEIVQERILATMKDEDNEIKLAHRWATINQDEQIAFAFQCENGTWDEIRELYRCLLVIIASYVRTRHDLVWYIDEETYYYHTPIDALETQWKPFITRWRRKIYEQFKPKYFLNNQQQPMFIASMHQRYRTLVIPPATYHERVEAQHHLSEWAHKNLSPEEAEALLQFD